MKNIDLCLSLVKADSEEDVIKLLKNSGFWDDEKAWRYFGDLENNFGDIGNQQSNADRALVEKLVNSVDAVLMAENYINSQKDHDFKQPNTIKEALETFYNIDEGKLSNLTPSERTKLAKKIALVATGQKSKPCFSIIDIGEGQTPNKMPETLLSLSKSNKLRVPFVQGKFNMGGTGVLRFCGRNNFELIISKRNPQIANNGKDESFSSWGFTLVRRENPTQNVRSSTYKYLAPVGKILSFDAEGLVILPGDYPEAYEKTMRWGTYIKLYEYDIGGLKTLINLNLNYRLALLLPQIALPVRLYERRDYSAHSYDATLSGLDVRLEDDKLNNLEEKYRYSGEIRVQGERIKYSIYPFKPNKAITYKDNEGIIFTVNGQTHGSLSKAFFTRKKVGLGYLADSLLVIADCSEFTGRAKEDLFKNDRETLVNCPLRTEIERVFEDEIRNHKGLRQLQEERKRAEITNKLADSKPLVDILSNIIKKSPALSLLLNPGQRLSNPFNLENGKYIEEYKGKIFPTFFKLKKQYGEANPKLAEAGRRFRIQFKTDVQNDYFERSKDPGNFELYLNDSLYQDHSINLWNGTATLSVAINTKMKIGQKLSFRTLITDVQNSTFPFEESFEVVVSPKTKNSGGTSQSLHPPTDKGGDQDKTKEHLGLPQIIQIRKDQWDEFSFDKTTSLRTISIGDGKYDFRINLDNHHLLSELKNSSPDEINLNEARYKYGLVLVALALISGSDDNEDKVIAHIDDIMDRISPIIIPIIAQLGELKSEEVVEIID